MGDRHLFVGNLCQITTSALRTYCEKYGAIADLSLNRDKDNNVYHCFAFVTFQLARCTTKFMSKRPHILNGEEIFVKRALPRNSASIPERLVVTNRLVIEGAKKYDEQELRNYFEQLGPIIHFDYKNGLIDFNDYDDVDCILLARPHYLHDREIFVTKFIPTKEQTLTDPLPTFDDDEKYRFLERQFRDYKQEKEKELLALRKELQQVKDDLYDVTQIKLDKLIKNQQAFQQQLLAQFQSAPTTSIHAQMCDDFLRSTPSKKRKTLLPVSAHCESEILF